MDYVRIRTTCVRSMRAATHSWRAPFASNPHRVCSPRRCITQLSTYGLTLNLPADPLEGELQDIGQQASVHGCGCEAAVRRVPCRIHCQIRRTQSSDRDDSRENDSR